ncbi:MAG TPA: hypothetical protein VK864_12485, partial [Longimicrobiales bacterium]|nr:hypothetical protein [Longimicrobiales bacterium]
FFALKGFKDATELAGALGKEAVQARFAAIRDEYQADLQASIRLAMQNHNIDYLPGAVELGDFDPTSTTVAVTPAAAQDLLPKGALQRTFERYWQESEARRTGARSWTAFTPYELRTVGTFARLGDRARALAMLDWFFLQQRPPAWNHWAEVVHRDADAPRFIGDMPHTWVGSDFIRSLTDLLAYEREADDALVIAAGVSPAWVTGSGLRVQGLSTHYGTLGYTMRQQGDSVLVTFEDGLRIGRGGLVIRSPLERPLRGATVDGRLSHASGEWLALPRIPRTVVLRYAQ